MNPIEMAFAKLKTLLRQAQERTRDGLWQRIGTLLDQFTLVPLHRDYDSLAGSG
jgi:transposase